MLHLPDTVFLGSLLKTNAANHLKVSVNLLAAETFQSKRNQSDYAHKWVKFATHYVSLRKIPTETHLKTVNCFLVQNGMSCTKNPPFFFNVCNTSITWHAAQFLATDCTELKFNTQKLQIY